LGKHVEVAFLLTFFFPLMLWVVRLLLNTCSSNLSRAIKLGGFAALTVQTHAPLILDVVKMNEVLIHLDHVTDYRPLQSPRWRSYSKIKI
jgi:hypothetical protein